MHAKDIMTAPARTVRAGAPLQDAIRLLEELSVTAAPVVDERGALVGLISEVDLLRQQTGRARAAMHGGTARANRAPGPGLGALRVAEVMSGLPVVAWPDSDVADIAAMMVQHGVHTVPVVVDERPVGVVSRCDVLRTILPTDVSARAEAQRRLDAYDGGRHRWSVVVHDGVATVGGTFDEQTEWTVAEALVRTTAGVRSMCGAGEPA
ncbi:CBS domain-containing protein [Dactylosporangium sp. NPDC000244]|uniref:CBS domain-containing protein n=1 Tax=Dactylosporangium sp. NPDC000244 TaxID=3154365 RepID=UPI00331ED5F9